MPVTKLTVLDKLKTLYLDNFVNRVREGFIWTSDYSGWQFGIHDIENILVGVVATWDSSAHENSKLNRVTPDHEKLYMIVKVVARITDPSPMGKITF